MVQAFNNITSISWMCNWYSSPPGQLGQHIQFVPQLYHNISTAEDSETWTNNAKAQSAQGATHFLSFGEPETSGSSYMSPSEGASAWMQDMQPWAEAGITVGAPGVLFNDDDFEWLSEFMSSCNQLGCKIGFIALHWMWTATPGNVDSLKNAVLNATRIADGLPVWLDNIGASGDVDAQKEFMGQVVPWLEQNDAVERYAWVPADISTGTGFINADGSISEIGQYYADLPSS